MIKRYNIAEYRLQDKYGAVLIPIDLIKPTWGYIKQQNDNLIYPNLMQLKIDLQQFDKQTYNNSLARNMATDLYYLACLLKDCVLEINDLNQYAAYNSAKICNLAHDSVTSCIRFLYTIEHIELDINVIKKDAIFRLSAFISLYLNALKNKKFDLDKQIIQKIDERDDIDIFLSQRDGWL